MGRIAELDAEINTMFLSKEYTEDGDIVISYKVTADSFDACRLANQTLRDKCDVPRSNWKWDDRSWTFNGGTGKWETKYHVCVDGIEDAIERSNDYYASMRYDPREDGMGF